jgi:protease Do-like 1, chloroplastic
MISTGARRRKRRPPLFGRTPVLERSLLAALLLSCFAGLARGEPPSPETDRRAITPRGELLDEEKLTIRLFRSASRSVVHITNLAVQQDIFSFNLLQIPQGTGSGFIWDPAGHIVTNFHVIQDAQAAKVTLADQSTWDARLVGVEADKDLAVLKIDAPRDKLQPIPLGTSGDLAVGQQVLAIGNPFGLDQTLTTGIISALGREIQSVTGRPIQGVIQTDAVINPGNSGGPLLDSAGRLIGVNTAIYSPSGTSIGIGFAVPVDTVNRIVPQLIRFGRVARPTLGIRSAEDQLAESLGLDGVLVLDVEDGGPAARAGIRPTRQDPTGRIELGDIVVAIDGQPVHNSNDLYTLLDRHDIGDTVTVTVSRKDSRSDIKAHLQAE